MPWGFVAAAAGTVIGSAISGHAATSAASTQAAAADRASQQQMEMFNRVRGDMAPWMDTGRMALGGLSNFMGLKPDGTYDPNAPGVKRFTGEDLAKDPGYQFRLHQGEDAVMNQRSAMGGVLSGATLKDLTQFGQGLASSEFNDAWKRYNFDQSSVYDRLSGISNTGENATAGVGTAGINTAASVGANTIGAGNARAAGTVGAANALNGGVSNLYNQWIMSQLMQSQGGGTPSAGLPSGLDYGGGPAYG